MKVLRTETVEVRQRFGDVLLEGSATLTMRDAIVDYEKFETTIEVDETMWYDDQHQYVVGEQGHSKFLHSESLADEADMSEMQGYFSTRDGSGVARYDDEDANIDLIYKGARKEGASKAIAFEVAAMWRQHSRRYAAKWCRGDVEYYWIKVATEGGEWDTALGGCEGYEYASTEGVADVSAELVAELEKMGYTVINKPEPKHRVGRTNQTADEYRANLKRNIHRFDWSGPIGLRGYHDRLRVHQAKIGVKQFTWWRKWGDDRHVRGGFRAWDRKAAALQQLARVEKEIHG